MEALCGKPPVKSNTNFVPNNENKNRRRRSAAEEEAAAKKSLDSLKLSSQDMLRPVANFQKDTQSIIDSLKNDRGIESLHIPFMTGKGDSRTPYEK